MLFKNHQKLTVATQTKIAFLQKFFVPSPAFLTLSMYDNRFIIIFVDGGIKRVPGAMVPQVIFPTSHNDIFTGK
jgi:hypothetical protein